MKDKIFNLTPLGRADQELKKYLDLDKSIFDSEEFVNYEESLKKYRNLKLLQLVVKVLLYAGVITSVAASVGLEELKIINRIASYLGVTFLLAAYLIVNYATMLHREEYHVKREILVSHIEIDEITEETEE